MVVKGASQIPIVILMAIVPNPIKVYVWSEKCRSVLATLEWAPGLYFFCQLLVFAPLPRLYFFCQPSVFACWLAWQQNPLGLPKVEPLWSEQERSVIGWQTRGTLIGWQRWRTPEWLVGWKVGTERGTDTCSRYQVAPFWWDEGQQGFLVEECTGLQILVGLKAHLLLVEREPRSD